MRKGVETKPYRFPAPNPESGNRLSLPSGIVDHEVQTRANQASIGVAAGNRRENHPETLSELPGLKVQVGRDHRGNLFFVGQKNLRYLRTGPAASLPLGRTRTFQ